MKIEIDLTPGKTPSFRFTGVDMVTTEVRTADPLNITFPSSGPQRAPTLEADMRLARRINALLDRVDAAIERWGSVPLAHKRAQYAASAQASVPLPPDEPFDPLEELDIDCVFAALHDNDPTALGNMGSWARTPQGNNYWGEVYARMKEGCLLDPDARVILEDWLQLLQTGGHELIRGKLEAERDTLRTENARLEADLRSELQNHAKTQDERCAAVTRAETAEAEVDKLRHVIAEVQQRRDAWRQIVIRAAHQVRKYKEQPPLREEGLLKVGSTVDAIYARLRRLADAPPSSVYQMLLECDYLAVLEVGVPIEGYAVANTKAVTPALYADVRVKDQWMAKSGDGFPFTVEAVVGDNVAIRYEGHVASSSTLRKNFGTDGIFTRIYREGEEV